MCDSGVWRLPLAGNARGAQVTPAPAPALTRDRVAAIAADTFGSGGMGGTVNQRARFAVGCGGVLISLSYLVIAVLAPAIATAGLPFVAGFTLLILALGLRAGGL
jgi:hypothetical protein